MRWCMSLNAELRASLIEATDGVPQFHRELSKSSFRIHAEDATGARLDDLLTDW
jgi:hypothetical protein